MDEHKDAIDLAGTGFGRTKFSTLVVTVGGTLWEDHVMSTPGKWRRGESVKKSGAGSMLCWKAHMAQLGITKADMGLRFHR